MGIAKINIADALFSKVQQRILALFFGHPDQYYYTNEVIRQASSGTGAVLRELGRLSAVGLLFIKQSGNQKLYCANKESLLFNELRNIVLKTFGVADVLKEGLESISVRIVVAFIYGSIAKHDDKADSDIDLMLIGDDISYPELYTMLEQSQKKLGRQINPTFYTKEEWIKKRKEGNNFIIQVINQPKIFIIGNDNELATIR